MPRLTNNKILQIAQQDTGTALAIAVVHDAIERLQRLYEHIGKRRRRSGLLPGGSTALQRAGLRHARLVLERLAYELDPKRKGGAE